MGAGMTASPLLSPYGAAKAGLVSLTKSLAVEWGKHGIRLNTIAPGEIPTEGMSKRLNPGEEPGARSRKTNPMARAGRMSELQNLSTFLMAPVLGEPRTEGIIQRVNALEQMDDFVRENLDNWLS